MKKLIVLLLLLVVIAALSAATGILLSHADGPFVGDAVLEWSVDRPIVDYRPPGSLIDSLGGDRQSFASIYRALAAARRDEAVRGIAVTIRNARFGLATAQELRALLDSLQDAGKFVDCYLETAGEGANGTLAYFLATACESITLAPAGDLNLLGLYADGIFLRGTLEKLRVDPHFSHVGEFKSAAEVFTEYGHTPAAVEAISAVLDSYYSLLLEGIGAARNIGTDRLSSMVDAAPYSAAEALDLGLVDHVAYPDEFAERIAARTGRDLHRTALGDYRAGSRQGRGPRLAVVFAQGSILRGRGGSDSWTEQRYVGSTDTVELLDTLAEQEDLHGIVLRIDSPGGSAQASDLILRAVERLAATKPVVVSMANVAASGGYYIAARADRIVASPATLTGSIGVVGGKFVTRRFQQELLGISHDTLKRGANADLYSPLEPFSPEQQDLFLRQMERVYETFVGHVADGRQMRREEVERVAGGRIWSGADALEHGLIDQLGGLDQAVAALREAAGLDPDREVRLDYYPRPPSLFEELLMARSALNSGRLEALIERLEGGTRPLLELPRELAAVAAPF